MKTLAAVPNAIARFYGWLQGKRTVAFALALVLVAVPTFAALFPGFIFRTDRGWRIAAMGFWLIVAAAAIVASQTRDWTNDARAAAQHLIALSSHRSVIRSHLTLILEPEKTGIPDSYRTCVYLPDNGLLLPWFPDFVNDTSDLRVFAYGKGATGTAYSEQRPVAVVGDAVSSEEYGLTPAQQELFANCQVVVAAPIRLLKDDVIGVLSTISEHNDGTFISDDAQIRAEGVNLLTELADEIGVTLEGMKGLKWQT